VVHDPNLLPTHTTSYGAFEHRFQVSQKTGGEPQIILILIRNHQVRHVERGSQLSLFAFR